MKNTQSALIIIDVQNDFCPGGALEVPEGDQIVPVINKLMDAYPLIAATQDWHTPHHISFASSHPGKQVFDSIDAGGFHQTLWPDHCVAGTQGAELHPDLNTMKLDLILRKGTSWDLDSYSAFSENDRKTQTGLNGWLKERGVTDLSLCGLALDVCVYFTAVDALELGYKVKIIKDAVRAVNTPQDSEGRAIQDLRQRGAVFI